MKPLFPLLLLLPALAAISGCEQKPVLERLKERGTLRIATVPGLLTCHLSEAGPAGLEYRLAGDFARSLELEPVFHVYPTRQEARQALLRGEVQMLAAARQATSGDRRATRLSTAWHQAPLRFVTTMGRPPLTDPQPPGQTRISVARGTLPQEVLAREHSGIEVEALDDITQEEILIGVSEGRHEHTLVDELLLEAYRSLLPTLTRGVELARQPGFHWYFSQSTDPSLRDAADRFLGPRKHDGTLDRLLDQLLVHPPTRDFVTLKKFWQHVRERLPDYRQLFEQAGRETGIDWRLLAAVGYQESHWSPRAVSPTGVRGIMMLTRAAARKEKVSDRADPAQSIAGGARHLRWMEERIPERIREPDRLWLTLASYNVGYGHLEDARVLTQRGGGNPDRWADVKKFLPLLSRKKYYSTVKHGKARGQEPVTYVENIHFYYRLLVWWDNRRRGLDCTTPDYPRLALKNALSSSAAGPANTPPSTSVK